MKNTPSREILPELTAFKNAVFRIRNCVIITTDAKGIVTGCNSGAEKYFGYTSPDVLGKRLTGILFPKKFLKDDSSVKITKQPSFKNFAENVLKAGESEWTVYSATGEDLLLELSATEITGQNAPSGYIFSGFDISEQRRIETAFEGIQLFNEKILSTTPTVLYLFDIKAQQIVFSNRDFYAAFGYSDEENSVLKGLSLAQLLHPEDIEKRQEHLSALAKNTDGDITEGEFRLRHADGSWKWMQNRDTVFMRDEDGSPTLILGAALDISERKKYEYALNEANNKLSETNRLLTDANNLKTELLGIAAHDLKNPLSVIKNLASILEENTQEEVIELSSVIRQASEHMLSLINELLESSALDSGRYPLYIEDIDLTILLEYVLQGNISSARKKGQNFIVSAEQECLIMADGSSMRRVLDNLISNAIKYSPFEKNIEISLFKKDGSIRLEVSDHGPGLNDEDMKKIFGKFQRLHAQPTGGENSSGLGLSIVKQIIDLHHGKVWAESQGTGKGTTFIVELPSKSNH